MDSMKKPPKSDKYDLHFIASKRSIVKKFIEEADQIGRTYTEHFKRVLEERYADNKNA